MAQFARIKIWVAGEVLFASDLNNEFNNLLAGFTPSQIDGASANVTAMRTTTDPGPVGTESLATNLLGELQRLRYMHTATVGGAQWYSAPTRTLEALNTYVTAGTAITVKTDGTDPGLRGYTSASYAGSASTGAPSVNSVVVTQALTSLVITKGANPLQLSNTRKLDNTSPFMPSFIIAHTIIGRPGTYFFNVELILKRNAVQIDKQNYDIQVTVALPASITGGSGSTSFIISSSNAAGGTVTLNAPSTVNVSNNLTMQTTSNRTMTIPSNQTHSGYFYIPYSAFNYFDTVGAGTYTYAIEMKLTTPNLTGSPGLDATTTMTGFYGATLSAKEL